MDRACLRKVYLEMEMGDVEADYHAVHSPRPAPLGVSGTAPGIAEGSEQNPMLAGIASLADVESALERGRGWVTSWCARASSRLMIFT
jgi:hypothetical protein